MAKPVIITRASKGSALLWTEGDQNLENLRDATITLTAGSGGTDVVSDLNGTVTLVAGTNVTLSGDNTAKTITINSTASGATNLDGLTDVVITTPATNNVLRYDGTNWVNTAASTLSVSSASTATTASTASTATTATNINISTTTGNSNDTTLYPVFVAANTTGSQQPHTDVNGLSFDATSNTLTIGSSSATNAASIDLFNTAGESITLIPTNSMSIGYTLTLPSTAGTSGQVLSTNGSGVLSWVTRGSGTVTSVGGTGTVNGLTLTGTVTTSGNLTLGGTLNLTTAPAIGSTSANTGTFTTLTVNAANDLRLADIDSSNYVGFKSPETVSTNIVWTLPAADGTNGQVLKTNGSGQLSWSTVSASPAGSNQEIQFNNAGALGASSSLIYDGTSFKCSSGNIESLYSNGDEGGEFRLAKPQTNTTLAGDVTIDIYQNKLRIFENGGSTRGVYLDLTGAANTVGSALAVQGTAASFTTLTTTTSASLKAINEGALYDLGTTGGTIAPDVANGNVQKITLNSALTLNAFTNPIAGQSLTLIIYGGTAYTSITSTMKFAGGVKTLTGTAGCIDILSVYYDGTNYFASLGKGFA